MLESRLSGQKGCGGGRGAEICAELLVVAHSCNPFPHRYIAATFLLPDVTNIISIFIYTWVTVPTKGKGSKTNIIFQKLTLHCGVV